MVKYIVSVSIYDTYSFDGGKTHFQELVHHCTRRFDRHSAAIDYAYRYDNNPNAIVELEVEEVFQDCDAWELPF